MPDVHNSEQRRKNMRAIKSQNTSIEVQIRKLLCHSGYRYQLNVKTLPGTPDIYLPKYRAAIQINGCLWHGHNCPQFVMPKTRTDFWKDKILSNVERDLLNLSKAQKYGVRQLIIWQCALQGGARLPNDYLVLLIERWLKSDNILSLIDKNGLSQLSQANYSSHISKRIPAKGLENSK